LPADEAEVRQAKKAIKHQFPRSGLEEKLRLQQANRQKQSQHQTCSVQQATNNPVDVILAREAVELSD